MSAVGRTQRLHPLVSDPLVPDRLSELYEPVTPLAEVDDHVMSGAAAVFVLPMPVARPRVLP